MGTHSQSQSWILLFCSFNIQHTMPCVSVLPGQITRPGYLAVLCFHSLPTLIHFLQPMSLGGGSAWVLPGYSFVPYPFHEMLSSPRCKCSLAVALYLLVSLLGIVVFPVFSKYIWFWKGISATLLMLPS